MPDDVRNLAADIRALMNIDVADGMNPDDALAAVMCVVAMFVAQVRDEAKRKQYVDDIGGMFGALVEFQRTGDDRHVRRFTGGTMQ